MTSVQHAERADLRAPETGRRLGATAVVFLNGLEGLKSIRDEWIRLTVHDPRYWMAYPFFEEALSKSIGGNDDVHFAVCFNDSREIRAIIPLRSRIVPVRRCTFNCFELVGSTFDDVSCQASSVDFPAASLADARCALLDVTKALRRYFPRTSLLLVGRATADSKALQGALLAHGKSRAHAQVGGSKWIAVDRPFEDIRKGLSGKFRISLRSSKRNLTSLGSLEFSTTRRNQPEFSSALERFLEIEASGWKGNAGTATGLLVNRVQNQRAFLQALAFRQDFGDAEIHSLLVNGQCIASQLWGRFLDTRIAFKIGYLEEYSKFQPGHLLTEYVLEDSCADPSLKTIDFVSDAAWLDKWRVNVTHHFYHYLPVRPLSGMWADLLLRIPSVQEIQAWRLGRSGG